MKQVPQIKTVIPMTNSIFTHMEYDFGMIEPSRLDLLFASNYGERNISPIVERVVTDFSSITDEELSELSALTLSIYRKKWDRYKDIYSIEYDNIHNYLDEYTESVEVTTTENGSNSNSSTVTVTDEVTTTDIRTDDLTKTGFYTSESAEDSNAKDSVYGFNSTEAVNANSNDGNKTANSTDDSEVKETGTQSRDIESNKTSSNVKEGNTSSSLEGSNKKERTFTHKGNIGNLTTQELIRQDIKLWEWNFIESVLNDVKDLLTLPIYLG